jgi:wobble nucleotide-excising tRNase
LTSVKKLFKEIVLVRTFAFDIYGMTYANFRVREKEKGHLEREIKNERNEREYDRLKYLF